MRDAFLRALVAAGVALWLITEALGLFHALRPGPVLAAWCLLLIAALVWAWPRLHLPHVHLDPVVLLCVAGCAAVLVLTAIVAAYSPPNSADAMAYHMPRVVYWTEQGSVRF